MKYLRLSLILAAASGIALADNPSDSGKSGSGSGPAGEPAPTAVSTRAVPRVLQDMEPADSMVVRLGPPPRAAAPSQPAPAAPPAEIAKVSETAPQPEPPAGALDDPGRPFLRRSAKSVLPANFERDSAIYCQKLIGAWSLEDATMLLGEPRGSRPAYDDRQKQNGTIWAFSDPSGRYRQIELDFEGATGTLRTVFGYPWTMTWSECRRVWGANVNAAEANKGRKFYSYLNRRLDVLVDPSGKVISLGLY